MLTQRRARGQSTPSAGLAAVPLARGPTPIHWRRETRTYPLQGDEVHELLAAHTDLVLTESVAEPDYRLDLFEDRA